MKTKKIISFLLSFIMLFSCCNIIVFADGKGLVTEGQKATIEFVYLLPDSDITDSTITKDGSGYTHIAPSALKKDDVFYIGIKTKDFSRIQEVADATQGITDLTVGLAFNPQYVYLEPDLNRVGATEAMTTLASTLKGRLQGQKTFLTEADTTNGYELDASHKKTAEASNGETWSSCFVKLNSNAASSGWVSEYKGEKDLYMAIIKFKVLDKPAPGTQVFAVSNESEDTMLKFGFDGDDLITGDTIEESLYQWQCDGSLADINTVIDFDFSKADIFPLSYSVNFYKEEACTNKIENFGKEDVPANTSITDANITLPTAGTDFDNPITGDDGSTQYFLKWVYKDKNNNEKDYSSLTTISGDECVGGGSEIKVYPKYKDGHKVNFHSNYGSFSITSPPSEKTKVVTVAPEADQVINESDKPTFGAASDVPAPDFEAPTGWSLVGWYTDAACTAGNEFNFETAAGGDGTKIDGTDTTTPTELYAKWAQEVTYTFDQNYTGAPANTTVKKTAGEKLGTDAPADPTRTTYDFKGWNTKSNGSGTMYDATNPIADLAAAADTTLYAIWEPKADQDTYTLTFDAVGGTLKNPTSITVVQGDPITQAMMPDDPEKTGATGNAYTFDGWFKDASPSNTDELTRPITLTEDTTAYAHWSYTAADKITITFDDQGATTAVSPTTIDIAPGDAIGALPTDPAKDGNSFSGWYPNADGTGTKVETTTTFSSNTTVYAKWAADVNYTFDYNYDGAPAATTIPQKAGTALGEKAPADPTRTDYDFKGWDTASNGTGTRYTNQDALKALNEASDLTLYAIWDAAASLPEDQKATVTFHSSVDGLNVTPPSITVKKGDKLIAAQLPTPTRTDYDLEGWYDKADVTGTKVTDTDGAITVADDMNAYAHWTYTGANPVTVTFNAPDSDGDTHTWAVTVGNGDKVGAAAPVVTKANNTFKAWVEADGTTVYDPANDAVTATKTVTATWTENITIKFDANTGNGTATDQVGKPTDKLALPADGTFTKPDYKLVGWNTAKNGSGAYVNNTMDLDAVKTAAGAATSTITLYAQWADATITNPDPNPPTPPTPDNGGVLVKFDTNAAGSANQTGVVDAKPNWKIPKLGDAIGADQMPTDPVRPHYVLKTDKWNTKPDGSGVNVDGTTAISSAALGDALVDKGNGTYEVTLYAQWDIDPSVDANDKIKVKFNDNEDGKGKDDNVQEFTIFRGDSIGFDLPTPADTTKAFEGWFEGTAGDGGVISFTGDALTKTTPINPTGTEVTYYAKSKMYLWVELQVKDDSNNDIVYTYDGTVKDPTYKVWAVVKPETGDTDPTKLSETPVASGTASALAAKGINITYEKGGTTATLRDAGTYSIKVGELSATSELGAQGASVAVRVPDTVTINAKGLNVTFDPAKQEAKKTSTQEYVKVNDLILADGALISGDAKDNVLKVTYKLWTDSNNNGVIDDGELGDAPANTLDIGTYVMEIGTADSNYAINSVASSVADKTLVTFSETQYPAAYNDQHNVKTPGTNLQFKIVPNDPSIKDVHVFPVKDNTDGTELGLKGNDYVADATFDKSEVPTLKDYYIRVTDTEADHVKFTLTLTNPETTLVTATDSQTPEGAVVSQNADKTWTITAPLTKKGTDPNVITITTKAGDAADAPTITYTFYVQQLVASASDMKVSVVKPVAPSPSATPVPTTVPVTLKDNTYKADRTFDNKETPDYTDYYTVISNDTTDANIDVTVKDDITKVTMSIAGDGAPAVTVTQGTAPNDKVYTGTFKPKAEGETVVTVTMTSPANETDTNKVVTKTYTVTFKRSLAKIELNPGNSPYGLIERMAAKYLPADQQALAWDATKIATAKTEFNKKNKFVKDYVPTGEGTAKGFSPKAWGFTSDADSNTPENVNSPNNLDRNIYTIFIYNKNSDNSRKFKDPGFTMLDSLGNTVADTQMKRSIKIKRMNANNLTSFRTKTTDDEIIIENAANNVEIDLKTSSVNLGTKGISPGIYTMEYVFTDPYTNEEVKTERPVVVLWPLCDVDLSNIINAGDASTVTSKVKGVSNPTQGLSDQLSNLYLYRIMDVDRSGIINAGDASTVTSKVKGVTNPLPFYTELK